MVKKRITHILFWSVISAAFIGPGTITTAAAAGAEFGYSLIWALVFSTAACIILQEASARLTLASNKNLGEALRTYLTDHLWGRVILWMIVTAILLGCAAYEAGNILGAVAGTGLLFNIPSYWVTLGIGAAASLLFWFGSVESVAKAMGVIVGFMGVCFVITAIMMKPDFGAIIQNGMLPSFPKGSSTLLIALIGTTVVPYNLFLGSGIAKAQNIKEMRVSLSIAIGLGGLISIAVLIVGSAIADSFSFEDLARTLTGQLGGWASWLLGLGLFAAGLSSSITAPLAAAVTAKSVFADESGKNKRWQESGKYYRAVWITVLLVGVGFGISGIQPVPAIILAQALNGIILPLVAIGLLIMVNNHRLMSSKAINSLLINIAMSAVVFITILIGVRNVALALTNALPVQLVQETYILMASLGIAILISWPVYRLIQKVRNPGNKI